MPTSAQTLVDRTRRLMRDYPLEDALTASCTSSATSITVADTSLYGPRHFIQIESEVLYSVSITNSTTLAVRRGQKGSTSASHANATKILVRPEFYNDEILDALNDGLDSCFPLLYRPVAVEYTGIDGDTYEYTLPNMSGLSLPIPYLYRIDVRDSGETPFQMTRAWEIVRSEDPFIKFRRPLTSDATIRLYGYGPFTHLASMSSELDTYFPTQAEHLPPLYAASYLLSSGEAGRVRVDTGAVDNREQANAVGSSLRASQALLQRFYTRLSQAAMPPLPKHIKSVL